MIVLAGAEVCERRKVLPPAPGLFPDKALLLQVELWGPCSALLPAPGQSAGVTEAADLPLPRGFVH